MSSGGEFGKITRRWAIDRVHDSAVANGTNQSLVSRVLHQARAVVLPGLSACDVHLCRNVASTYYVVTPMKNSTHSLRDGESYVACTEMGLT